MGNTMELLNLLWPIIVVQLAMQVFCLVKLFKTGSRNLSKLWWTLIIIILSILGPVVFLLFGINRGDSHDFS
ncbi:PLDc N-terminal domain-containing protein [Clostridium sp. 'deep sea']|uniref:PLDc N-terminal domain-containing protein n=1 Tax=Clostridium sp. 'deep sea' TaxID=2779445 RepID=UPI0018969802|nr:PLDc N-terminal domain-containing protein [Clostridium sp. 'deep sea']QOR33633.1 PLDc N-terminal domain-containing protein [Clostridium sp. 'deep sea']